MSNQSVMNPNTSENTTLESDEPYDDIIKRITGPPLEKTFSKGAPPLNIRRESLLTRQLHPSEGDSHVEDEYRSSPQRRPLVCGRSVSSNPSVASTAELTSDNDLTSPGTRASTPSPPLLPRQTQSIVPLMEKPIGHEPFIVGQDVTEKPMQKKEDNVEAGLGRRRCITFACGGKQSSPKPKEQTKPENAEEVPKRKCALTFACPTRSDAPPATPYQLKIASRHLSPAPRSHTPKSPRSPRSFPRKAHRGSDSTLKNESPTSIRKVPSLVKRRKYSEDIDDSQLEAKRFHEFGTTEKVEEDWIQESGCHRSRLTVRDTLHKENVIRQIGEEVEEEALDEDCEEDDGEDAFDEVDEDEDEGSEDDDEDEHAIAGEQEDIGFEGIEDEDNAISDAGFDTDDEGGFAISESEDADDSENEWWAPGRSTAATSHDNLDLIRPTTHRKLSDSSVESARDANGLSAKPRPPIGKRRTHSVKINRPNTPELPDSTDFVCGTLDEDRPLEQAYISCLENRKAAKHKVTPQDIDPTFPTSDLEMDEEDDDEEDEVKVSSDDDQPIMMHGKLELNDDDDRRRGRINTVPSKKKSPPHSPRRLRSPPPPVKKHLRSPPPPARTQRNRSPAPPRQLFGHSPKGHRSPRPCGRLTSPPNSRRSSLVGTPSQIIKQKAPGLGQRPAPTMTASLPRVPTLTKLQPGYMARASNDDDDNEESSLRPRRAIDIVKGLEKKRHRRSEKLYQKQCQKAKKDGDRKPKPGKGAERMRELGLELAAYRGKKAEHMLSY